MNFLDQLLDQLKDWQTLISGVAAVIAAFIGSILLWKQTAQTKETIEDQRLRELDKARTLAQFELSALYSAVELFAKEIVFILEHQKRPHPILWSGWPTSALAALANIQLHCGPNERKQFAVLFQNLQVLQARLMEGVAETVDEIEFRRLPWIYNAWMLAQVRSAIEALFIYCRFESSDLHDFDQFLQDFEGTFYSWNIKLKGDPEDRNSEIAAIRRERDRTLDKRDPIPWYARPSPRGS